MTIVVNAYLKNLENKINRTISLNEKVEIKEFCECLLSVFDGDCKKIYQLTIDDKYIYDNIEGEYENYINLKDNDTLENLNINEFTNIKFTYDFLWNFSLKIESITSDSTSEIKVIDGIGPGIFKDEAPCNVIALLNSKNKKRYLEYPKSYQEYINKKFNLEEINIKLKDDLATYKENKKAKHYIINVNLDGFKKEIKRKIIANDYLMINEFCNLVAISMNADLSHIAGMKIGKEYIGEEIEYMPIKNLKLQEKQKLVVLYDYGDNWQFNVTISKIENKHHNKSFEIIDGCGYGIIDDCGGIYELSNIFAKKNNEWGDYDINDFNIKELNKRIDKYI